MNDDQPVEFVSRRGKRTHAVVAVPVVSSVPKTKPKVSRPSRRWWRPRFRVGLSLRGIVITGLLLVLAIGAAVVYADGIKREYERQTAAMKRSVRDAGTMLPSTDASATAVSDRLLQALNASTTCQTNGLDITLVYPPAGGAKHTCKAVAEKYTSLKASLQTLKNAAVYIEKIDTTFEAALAQPSDSGYAIAQDYAANWSKALESLKALSPPSQLTATHAALQQKTTAVKTAWENYAAANSAQDASAFTTAESQLQTAYTDFRTCADGLRDTVSRYQAALTSAVSSLQ